VEIGRILHLEFCWSFLTTDLGGDLDVKKLLLGNFFVVGGSSEFA
jgi:hypothetical protein